MNKILFIFVAIIITITLVISSYNHDMNCHIIIDGEVWNLEIANTPKEREYGLMNRETLCENCGMLFIFDDEVPRTFWMQNTLIPLDMYFYNSEWSLADQALNMRPMNETETPATYTSKSAKYVLETNIESSFIPELFDPRDCQK